MTALIMHSLYGLAVVVCGLVAIVTGAQQLAHGPDADEEEQP